MSQPQSPAQILKSVEREERGELERIIADLEEEQRCATPQQKKTHCSLPSGEANGFFLSSFGICCLSLHNEVKI